MKTHKAGYEAQHKRAMKIISTSRRSENTRQFGDFLILSVHKHAVQNLCGQNRPFGQTMSNTPTGLGTQGDQSIGAAAQFRHIQRFSISGTYPEPPFHRSTRSGFPPPSSSACLVWFWR